MGGKEQGTEPPLEQLRLLPTAPKPPASWGGGIVFAHFLVSTGRRGTVFSIYYYFKQHHWLLAALIRLPLLGRLFCLGGTFRDWLRGDQPGYCPDP